jgi:Fe-S-cluster containining protein
MLERYESQLNQITDKINFYFTEQKDYIKCKMGCGLCCSSSYYPISELEYKYLKKGIELYYSKEDIDALHKKAWEIYKNRQEFKKQNPNIFDFVYVCPFLKDNVCSVYQYRPIICRAYGLILKDSINPDKKSNLPYCVDLNLNYANVWDAKKKSLSKDKIESFGFKVQPKVYDVSCSTLMNLFEDATFGDIRMIYEWVIMDIPDYEEIMKLY